MWSFSQAAEPPQGPHETWGSDHQSILDIKKQTIFVGNQAVTHSV